jgi:predicted secreted Zn-dependent protease
MSPASRYLPVLTLCLLLTGQYQSVEAKINQLTTYSFFKVKGQSAREIYTSLLNHAKGPGGHDAYATTAIQVFQKSKVMSGTSCRLAQVNLDANFKITLPKLEATPQSATVEKTWRGFATVLRNHEEHHRSLWMACVRILENQAKTLQATSCASLGSKFKQLWKTIEATCLKQNNSFDKVEQAHLLQQPFIKMVISRN